MDKLMMIFPSRVIESQTACALRFNGYEYEKFTCNADPTGAEFAKLIDPVVKTLQLHSNQNDNHAAFFGLQRHLNKWGGEYLTNYSDEHIAYDFLFLHLYKAEVDERF